LARVIEQLTESTRAPSPASTLAHEHTQEYQHLLRELKNYAKASPESSELCFDLLFDRLQHVNVQVRLLTLRAAKELFSRSTRFRTCVVRNLNEFTDRACVFGDNPRRRKWKRPDLLPELRRIYLDILSDWSKRFANPLFPELVVAHRHLQSRLNEVCSIDPSQERNERVEANRRQRLLAHLDQACQTHVALDATVSRMETKMTELWSSARKLNEANRSHSVQIQKNMALVFGESDNSSSSSSSSGSSSTSSSENVYGGGSDGDDDEQKRGRVGVFPYLEASQVAEMVHEATEISHGQVQKEIMEVLGEQIELVTRIKRAWVSSPEQREAHRDLGEKALLKKMRVLAVLRSAQEFLDKLGRRGGDGDATSPSDDGFAARKKARREKVVENSISHICSKHDELVFEDVV